MSVNIYVDLRSQPCRALVIFLKNSDIPFELKFMDLMQGDHRKPEYASIFPLHTVPGMSEGDYRLCETVAIFRYLTSKYAGMFPDHWYPADLEARGRVDEYLSYHHNGTRTKCLNVFFSELHRNPGFKSTDKQRMPLVPEEQYKRDVEKLSESLDLFETCFLKEKDYICGDEVTFADVMAVCEYLQLTVSRRDVTEGRHGLKNYFERVKKRLNPIFDEVHSTFYEARDLIQSRVLK